MQIFQKLKRTADPRARVVTGDLSRLDAVRDGLGRAAVEYVLTGDDETVLASVASSCSGTELQVCASYPPDNSPSWARRRLLVRLDPYDVELVRRYVGVLAAACPSLPDGAVGTDAVPQAVRVLFTEAFAGVPERPGGWPRKPASIDGKGLTLPVALEATLALGGTAADLADVLYNERQRWEPISAALYRSIVDVRWLAEADPEAFVAAGRRIFAPARAKLIADLAKLGLSTRPVFLEFILEQTGDSAKAGREAAIGVLSGVPADLLVPLARRHLAGGSVSMRAGMVELLAKLGTEDALAVLREHRAGEKTARIVAAIDTALSVGRRVVADTADTDDETRYLSLTGERVDVPPARVLEAKESVGLGAKDRSELAAKIAQENERIRAHNEELAGKGMKFYRLPLYAPELAHEAIELFNGGGKLGVDRMQRLRHFLSYGPGAAWARQALARLPRKRALAISALTTGTARSALYPYAQGPLTDYLRRDLTGPDGDLRRLEALDIALGIETTFGYGTNHVARKTEKGDFLRHALYDGYAFLHTQLESLPADAVWPYLAENFAVLDEAFGLKPPGDVKLSRIAAIRVLARMPKPPARYFAPLLEAATGDTKAGRAEARSMLKDVAEVAERIVALLDDSRQSVRAGAAEWLAERRDDAAIPALRKRLAKEKSELARAAMLTALKTLGADLESHLGPDALLAEAEKGLRSAGAAKLEWLAVDHLPRLRYRSGAPVPPDVPRWWIVLAVKLKQPGGNALFDLYLDQLDAADAETFSTWLLDAWINYDTARPAESDANAHAQKEAPQRLAAWQRWDKTYTLERAFADLKREYLSVYPNSGAATKGLLALAKRAAPSVAADRVRAYLKNHGSRTSQASALLEMLAGSGSPVALQVVIAAATRLKQKGVQKLAGELVLKVAEARDWSLDELADRTIPSAGLDDEGVLELLCGEDRKRYTAVLDPNLNLVLRNAEGRPVKALPGGQDDATKEAKKQLAASRRELKQVVAMQSARLYEALCAGRVWPLDDFRRDYLEHPIMRRLVQRLVWFGLDGEGKVAAAFRPTAEGDFTDARDGPVAAERFSGVRLAYGALMSDEDAAAWKTHLDDYEVEPLFAQLGREMLKAEAEAATRTAIDDRKGWVTDTFTLRGAASKLGYERGEALDGGFFNQYVKTFPSAGVAAVIEFSGNCLPEQNVPASVISLSFEKMIAGGRGGTVLELREVPPVLLSECWNDYRTMAAKGVYDEHWEKRMPWM